MGRLASRGHGLHLRITLSRANTQTHTERERERERARERQADTQTDKVGVSAELTFSAFIAANSFFPVIGEKLSNYHILFARIAVSVRHQSAEKKRRLPPKEC